jgi:hypothetical protein
MKRRKKRPIGAKTFTTSGNVGASFCFARCVRAI